MLQRRNLAHPSHGAASAKRSRKRLALRAHHKLRGPSWRHTVVSNTTRGGGAVKEHDGHKRSDALSRLGE